MLLQTIIVADIIEFDGTRHLRYRDLAEVSFSTDLRISLLGAAVRRLCSVSSPAGREAHAL